MRIKSIKNQVLFGLPILAVLSALPRVAQAQEEIRFDGIITLKTVEEAQAACAKEAVAPIWKAVFGRDLSERLMTQSHVGLQSGFPRLETDITDGENRVVVDVSSYGKNYTESQISFEFFQDKLNSSIVQLRSTDFPIVAFEVPENSPYDLIGNPVSKDFTLKKVRVILNKKMTPQDLLENQYTRRTADIHLNTTQYVMCLCAYFRK